MPKAIGADKKRETNTIAQAIGTELTELRRARKLSQQRLADRLGYDVSHVRQTEMGGNPTLEFLNAVATYFSLKPIWPTRRGMAHIRAHGNHSESTMYPENSKSGLSLTLMTTFAAYSPGSSHPCDHRKQNPHSMGLPLADYSH